MGFVSSTYNVAQILDNSAILSVSFSGEAGNLNSVYMRQIFVEMCAFPVSGK